MSFISVFTLVKRGSSNRGLICDADGVMLGPTPLVSLSMHESASNGRRFVAVTADELAAILTVAYGPDFEHELPYRAAALKTIERSLNSGRLTEATIAAVHLRLPELTFRAAEDLAAFVKYNPTEARDWHGRWTIGGSAHNASQAQDHGVLVIAASDSLSRCIDECYRILEKPLPYKWSDLNRYEFLRCVDECKQRSQ